MFRKNVIYFVVILIGMLLLCDILLTNYNNKIIAHGRTTRQQINSIKIYYDQIGKVVIHSLDIGLRGYALKREARFAKPMDNALAWRDSIFTNTEEPLQQLHFDMSVFYVLKDSVETYTRYCFYLKELLTENKTSDFIRLFETDKGAMLWNQYLIVEKKIDAFIDIIDQNTRKEIDQAMSRNQALQILLFLVCYTLPFTPEEHSGSPTY
jgi:hypothetical protein